MRKACKSLICNNFWVLILLLTISGHIFAQYSPTNPAPLKEWTFLIYVDGDNDLEQYALEDFIEMASIGSNTDLNIVVMLDRIGSYSTLYDNWTITRRGYVQFGDTPVSSWGENLGEINMGDPQSLKDFISWGSASFPSNRTALVLWNHGNGWSDYYVSQAAAYSYSRGLPLPKKQVEPAKAICLDDTSQDDLSLPEIRIALEELKSDELINIDLFGMDACLMAMVEVVTEFKNVADYFVGSPAEEPADGWPYDTIFQDLQINPLISNAELGTMIVNRYYQSYITGETLVALDLAGVDPLLTALNTFSNSLIDNHLDSPQLCLIDASEVQNALNSMIVAEKHGTSFQGAHGLAINFPVNGPETDYNSSLLNFVDLTDWEDFLSFYNTLDWDSWIRDCRSNSLRYGASWDYYDLYSFCDGVFNLSPVGVDVSPTDDYIFFGQPGGPFSQTSVEYQVTNHISEEISWQASVSVSWLTVSPASGILAADASDDITVSINPEQTVSMEDGIYTTNIEIIDSSNLVRHITILLALGKTDYLTEVFSGIGDNSFDLEYKTLVFTPGNANSFYLACVQDADEFEVDPAGAIEVFLSDDDAREIPLNDNFIPFFGQLYNSIFIGSNGYLTFMADTEFTESISTHFNLPRISAFFDDLGPIDGVTRISYLLDGEKLVVTYEDIGELSSNGSQTGNENSFQIQMFYAGIIKITWLEIEAGDGLVGLSNGVIPDDFLESNLNRYQQCQQAGPMAPIALDSHLIMNQELSKSIILSAYDDGLPQDLEFFITELPTKGKLYNDGVEISVVPYSLGTTNILSYQLGTSINGVDYFSWYANDGQSDSNLAVTSIEILPPMSYFCESFLAGYSDLSGLSITFEPDNSDSRYSVCIDSLAELPNDPNLGTRILNYSGDNDDVYQEVVLTNSKLVSLYGVSWSSFYVSANGNITFGSGTTEYQFTILEHFSYPRISMFYTDLNPDYGGEVYYQQFGDRVVVSFNNVRDRSSDTTYTFQAELFFDGIIKIHWLDVDDNSDLTGVGLSEGLGMPSSFVENDFSASPSCIVNNPIALDSTVEVWAGQSVPVLLDAQYADEYIISALPLYGSLYVGQTLIDTVPYGLGSDSIVLYSADRDAQTSDQFQWYCYDSTSDMMTVSNTATVDVLIHSCDVILEPTPVMPEDLSICHPVNLPLMWDVPILETRSSGVTYSGMRSIELQERILDKKMNREPALKGIPTISALPTKAFINIPDASVNVLMFVKYANNTSGGEVENTLNAVAQYFTDFSVTLTDEEDPILLGQLLDSHQVFIIPEQQNTIISVASALGNSWSGILNDFVERGGIVIACDYFWGAYQLMNSAGLMQVQTVQPTIIGGLQLDRAADNLLTDNIEQAFVSSIGTVAYDSTDNEILVSYQGSPVAVAGYTGHGIAILLGWDYYSYDDNYARIIANAVRLGIADLSYDIYLDTVNPPVNIAAQGHRFKILDPGILELGQQYYWKVDVSNNCGDYVSGPVWSFTTTGIAADFDGDCKVDLSDISYLAANWLNSDCSASWFRCDGTDIDRSGDVGFSDLAELAQGWLSSN